MTDHDKLAKLQAKVRDMLENPDCKPNNPDLWDQFMQAHNESRALFNKLYNVKGISQ